jgi:hypothetical protein
VFPVPWRTIDARIVQINVFTDGLSTEMRPHYWDKRSAQLAPDLFPLSTRGFGTGRTVGVV